MLSGNWDLTDHGREYIMERILLICPEKNIKTAKEELGSIYPGSEVFAVTKNKEGIAILQEKEEMSFALMCYPSVLPDSAELIEQVTIPMGIWWGMNIPV